MFYCLNIAALLELNSKNLEVAKLKKIPYVKEEVVVKKKPVSETNQVSERLRLKK